MLKRFILKLRPVIFCLVFNGILQSCNEIPRNHSHPEINDESILRGRELASVYCQSCHLLPDPSLLDSKSWEKGVLPHMGPLLGIFQFKYQRYPFNSNDMNLGPGYYPSHPALKTQDWQNIMDYYVATSPDILRQQQRDGPITKNLPLFVPHVPVLSYNNPAISFIKIQNQELFACDLFKQTLYRFNKQLSVTDSMKSSGAIVDGAFEDSALLTCNIGVFNPNNAKYGDARYIRINSAGKLQKDTVPLFNGLARPVQIAAGDFNKDGKTDYVVCEFGYLSGALTWMENKGSNKFERHTIKPVPGAIKAYVRDYNHDGLPDLWVLFAQGEEGIFLFTNKGGGRFEGQEVLRFPPSYGSSGFELDDFNNDGYPDILYTCGDNGDYSPVLKPYHGVYIFINDGKNNFTQQYFFPINGCYKALARDFDGDGDLDIATIAFFADYAHQPEEGFVYLENFGGLKFKPFTLPEAETGRWITMEAGDIDGDGKIDLVLGNFSSGPTMMESAFKWEKGPPFLLLKNNGTGKK